MSITEKMIVLKTFRYGESDLIVHGITMSGAKLHLFARSALKSRKRFGGGVLESLNYVEAVYKAPHQEQVDKMGQLQEASVINGFKGLRTDYDRLELAFYFANLIGRLAQQGGVEDGQGLFHIMGNALRAAETSKNLSRLKTHVELKVLAQQGVLPEINNAEKFLRTPLHSHESIIISADQFIHLRTQIKTSFDNYL